MARPKEVKTKEDYEKDLRSWYESMGAEFGSARPEGDTRYLWDLIELELPKWSSAPSQADLDKEEQERKEAVLERRAKARHDAIRRRTVKIRGNLIEEVKKYHKSNLFDGELRESHWDMVREELSERSVMGGNELENIHSSLSAVAVKMQEQYETMKRLKMLVGKLKNNVLNDYHDGDLDVVYEDSDLKKVLEPLLDELFDLEH